MSKLSHMLRAWGRRRGPYQRWATCGGVGGAGQWGGEQKSRDDGFVAGVGGKWLERVTMDSPFRRQGWGEGDVALKGMRDSRRFWLR